MTRDVYTLRLWRENRHIEPKPVRDIWEIVQFATCLFLYGVIVVLVMA